MNTTRIISGIVLPILAFAHVATADDDFKPLFDGTSLKGWVQHGGKAKYQVESGEIVGTTVPNTPNSFLCTEKEYGDFILEIDFKVDPQMNSGVQIRSHVYGKDTEIEVGGKRRRRPPGTVYGYQVEIDPSERAWTGGIYDESRRGWLNSLEKNEPARKAFKQGQWNHFRIECRGSSIKTWLNGVAAADLNDSMTKRGFIALQVHGVGKDASRVGMQVRWRNIRIKELAEHASRPNIIFILADDLGWTDLGCTGSTYYETPNIDHLAAQGMRFNCFYVCQNCAPTRAALLSGQYAPRTGIYTVSTFKRGRDKDRRMVPPINQTKLPLDKITIAQALKQAGYATAMFGKWHLGNGPEYHPSKRGFDEAIVSSGRHFDFATAPAVEVEPGAYLADFLTDHAVRFIERHADEPFFLYLPHFAVHLPLQAKPASIEKYESKTPTGGHNNSTYAAMIASVDESVGRITAVLDKLKLTENTLLIFASDNGGLGGYRVPGTDRTKGITDNAPLRSGKGSLYEGGIRVPLLARWPAAIKPGTSCDVPIVHVDLYPTFLQLAGAEPDADVVLDGVNFADLFRAPDTALDRDAIYWQFPGYLQSYIPEAVWRTTPVSVIRAGDYKLLEFFEDDRIELYNVRDDIGEQHDLAASMPGRAKQMHKQLASWRREIGAAMPRMKTPDELANPVDARRKKRKRKAAGTKAR